MSVAGKDIVLIDAMPVDGETDGDGGGECGTDNDGDGVAAGDDDIDGDGEGDAGGDSDGDADGDTELDVTTDTDGVALVDDDGVGEAICAVRRTLLEVSEIIMTPAEDRVTPRGARSAAAAPTPSA